MVELDLLVQQDLLDLRVLIILLKVRKEKQVHQVPLQKGRKEKQVHQVPLQKGRKVK